MSDLSSLTATGSVGGLNTYGYGNQNPISNTDITGLYNIDVSAGFDIPFSAGVAVGKSVSATLFSGNPKYTLTYNGIETNVEIGAVYDFGGSLAITDLSGTGGKCAGRTISIGLGKRGFGISITLRKDLSLFHPLSYIDAISVGVGPGLALPVTVSSPLEDKNEK